MFEKSAMDDFNFVDVEGDIEGEMAGPSKKKDLLEEGKRIARIGLRIEKKNLI